MGWNDAKDAVQRLWQRRWVRLVTYSVVAGTGLGTLVPRLATHPRVLRWTIQKLDAIVREETGLGLSVARVEFHPASGLLVMHDLRLGDTLLSVRRLELRVEFWSLLGPTHRIRSLRLEHPRLLLTEQGLAQIRLRPRPPRTGPLPQFRLDQLTLVGGEILVPEPLRGVPATKYLFEVRGTGLGPNHLRVDVTGPQLSVRGPAGWEKGRLDLNAEVSEPVVRLHEAYLRVGESQVRLNGRLEAAPLGASPRLDARLTGVLDLLQTSRWAGQPRAPLAGTLDLTGTMQGDLASPVWTFAAEGQDLRPAAAVFQPGALQVKASGSGDRARLDRFRWTSPQGDLDLDGQWGQHAPFRASFRGSSVDLGALGAILRLPEFQGVQASFQGQIQGPEGDRWQAGPNPWTATFHASLLQHGREAGGIDLDLAGGRATVARLALDLQTLKLAGTGWAALDPGGLAECGGEGQIEVGADQVARTLRAWDIVDLDMAGQTRAQARVSWTRRNGLRLEGAGQVSHPRWHGARADHLQADVEIRGSELRLSNLDLHKEEGRGGGDIWLTWGSLPAGQPQMDMCFTASRLPIAEGLRAADLSDAEGKELPLGGLGSGWVRLRGPFSHIEMFGAAQVETGEAYGVKIPAASSDFWMDLETLRLKLADLRVAGGRDHLGQGDRPPEGALALSGQAEMDFRRWTWWVDLGGRLDSLALALPGPRFQAHAQIHMLGPLTAPFGALDLPEGTLTLSRGRVFFEDRSLEGFEGRLQLAQGRMQGHLGFAGLPQPLLDLDVRQSGPDLVGQLALTVAPEAARTPDLARSLTGDLLEDLALSARLQGEWKRGRELAWTGSLDRLAAQFGAFELHQTKPSGLRGTASGAEMDMILEGGARASVGPEATQAARIHLSGWMPFLGDTPLDLRGQGSADLAHLKTILDRVMEVDQYSLLSELRVQGTSRFDLRAHGTYFDPQLDGTLSLSRGQMRLRGYQGVEDLEAEVVLQGRTLALPEDRPLRGSLGHGELRATGAATWVPGGLEAYAIQATLANFQLRDVPEGMDLQGSLEASLEGTEGGGLLKGRLRADRLSYQTEVKLADLILRSALSDSGGLSGLDPDDPLERIRLDLDLDLRSPWSFDTNLLKLDGRTDGPFQIVGTLGHPLPKGTMVFQPGGRLTNIFPAGDMVVDRGSLAFSELRPLDPFIALQGSVSSIPGYTVNLDIHGTLSNLAIVPSSTPSLRQDEIVAILINPGNAANVGTAGASSGATQGAITSGLASAGSGLISTLAFAPFQEQLRRTLGLDRVNVAVRTTSLGTTETEVTLGKSISLLGQRSAFVVSHKKSGELSITSGQVEWRFGGFILQLGASKAGTAGLDPSGEVRHTWSPR